MTMTTMSTNVTTTAKTMMASTTYSPSGPNSPSGTIYSQTETMFRSVLTYFSAGGAATATETAVAVETEATTETATESMMAMAEATMTVTQGSEAEDKEEWRRCSEKLGQMQGPDEPEYCMWDEAGMMERVRRGTSPL
jgi:hypothetical protein